MNWEFFIAKTGEYLPVLLGGSGLTYLVTWIKNRIQKMECHYSDDDTISRIPVTTETGEHKNLHYKEFKLVNTTNKDIRSFRIIFEFDADSKVIKPSNFSKTGKDELKPRLKKANECSYTIKNFNRGDEIKFFFDIANISNDEFSITEADCIGFKIVTKDKRKSKKNINAKIVTKEKIQR